MTEWKSRRQRAEEDAAAEAQHTARVVAQVERDVYFAFAARALCGDPLLARYALLPSQIDEVTTK